MRQGAVNDALLTEVTVMTAAAALTGALFGIIMCSAAVAHVVVDLGFRLCGL